MTDAEKRMLWAAVAVGTIGPIVAAILWSVIL